MKKFMKVAAIILTVAIAVSCQPGPGVVRSGSLEYEENGTGLTVKSYDGNETHVVVPRTVGGKTVTAIGDGAFKGNTEIQSLSIPDSVTVIGERITEGCTGIVELKVFPASERGFDMEKPVFTSDGNCIIRIDENAVILGCKASIIPDNVVKIGPCSFEGVEDIENLVIGNNVEMICDFAFSGCPDLKSVKIGKKVSSIGFDVFMGCNSLEKIEVVEGNKIYRAEGNCIMMDEKVKDSEDTIKLLVAGCPSSEIPRDTYAIGEGAFQNLTAMKELVIPEFVKELRQQAFFNTGITSISIPSGVTSIQDLVFGSCRDVEKVEVAEGNTAYRAENDCLIEIAEQKVINGFKNCTVIPGSVDIVGYRSFMWIPLQDTELTIEEGVKVIEEGAFRDSRLKAVKLPDSLIRIGHDPFEGCQCDPDIKDSLKWSFTLVENEVEDPYYRLDSYNGNSPDIVVPADIDGIPVKHIRNYAIRGARTTKTLTIPSSVEIIDEGALVSLKVLESIKAEGNDNFEVKDGCLMNKTTKTVISGTKNCNIPAGTLRIGKHAFKETAITKLELPEGLKEIGDNAFDCLFGAREKEMTIDIPASVEIIGNRAFSTNEKYPVKVTVPYSSEAELPDGWDKNWFDGDPSHVIYAKQK